MSSTRTILITGANTGLGFETVKALYNSSTPYTLILGCRSLSKAETAISTLKSANSSSPSTLSSVELDISSDSSIAAAVESLTTKYGSLDTLINNAGGNFDGEHQAGNMSLRAAWNQTWDLNVSGTMVLTSSLVPLLLKSSHPQLMFITSGTSALAETERTDTRPFAAINGSPAAGWPKEKSPNPITVYRSAKAGLNMAMREWYRILKGDGVKVWAVSPGFLATGLAGVGQEKLKQMGALDPSVGGEFIRDVVEGKRDGDVGKVIRNDSMIQPW